MEGEGGHEWGPTEGGKEGRPTVGGRVEGIHRWRGRGGTSGETRRGEKGGGFPRMGLETRVGTHGGEKRGDPRMEGGSRVGTHGGERVGGTH